MTIVPLVLGQRGSQRILMKIEIKEFETGWIVRTEIIGMRTTKVHEIVFTDHVRLITYLSETLGGTCKKRVIINASRS